ncbi:hypothetical protein QOT17_001948 [Balamuthia mandrillaris]
MRDVYGRFRTKGKWRDYSKEGKSDPSVSVRITWQIVLKTPTKTPPFYRLEDTRWSITPSQPDNILKGETK